MRFTLIQRNGHTPTEGKNVAYLRIDKWNDYSFVTMFQVTLFDSSGVQHELGSVKIGFKGQTEATSTHSTLASHFQELSDSYFSVGADVDYYIILVRDVPQGTRDAFLNGLRDIAYSSAALELAQGESVFDVSLMRGMDINTVTDQYRRVLAGDAPLTDYAFRFTLDTSERRAGYQVDFKVTSISKPQTNIHAIIGRNGVGKTTLLNAMTQAITEPQNSHGRFEREEWFEYEPIGKGYFGGVISVSFSAFDPFNPPKEQPDPSKGTCYSYVGLKGYADEGGALLKSQTELAEELVESLSFCLSEKARASRWREAILNLESDDNFAEMNLLQLEDLEGDLFNDRVCKLFRRMSSGHAIVLLTITKLVARVNEKTLVLFDEPESHLHPPLLSALVRSLSRLLTSRNAIAVLATHSPVVLQEVPKSCVWKISRVGLAANASRPDVETFGENVGVLTREVFGLEVSKSGFNRLLHDEAKTAESYDDALWGFDDQIGMEGRAILRALMHNLGKC
ncbi:AAA family ATPase [Rhodovulum sulfidophilum]|uniref:AAA family ATPase n=1 Tax=Rhodovulum sulfidophilum TaxID=35806 RepID=A0ABS1S1F2_RHOSU|nr:AAA family ATPase [Rhodovulum sulfidophilum]MBL3611019.1 AAA family ATPase [Rhodovulum sulfidophilum]MCE8457898.1 ATP-binding protein [Rhodovulum sulfidophilum]